jgi:hypothetical protein
MDWYYAEGGKQQGPVSEEEFGRLRETGVVRAETLVWREGMANWQPYQQVAGQAQPGSSPVQGGMVCSQCGNVFGPDQVIRSGDVWVCGECKPRVLQRLRAGDRGHGGGQGTTSPGALLARDYTVDAGDCLNRSWAMFKSNPGSILGATVLVYLVLIGVNIIPYLSIILSLILTGPLMGGLWCFYLRYVRGQRAEVGEVFSGFGPRFGQLVLANVVTGILAGLCLFPAAFILALGMGISMGASGEGGGGGPELTGGLLVVFIMLMAVGIAGYVYLTTCWFFTLPLVADKGMRFWPAMELGRQVVIKHWWGTFWVILAAALLTAAGALVCLAGVLLTGPVAMGMLAFHYEKVFGDLQPELD